MPTATAQYGQLESAGWKAIEGTAIHPDNAQGRFYLDLFERASRRGEAVIYRYRFDDRIVAMNLCLARAGTLVVLKTTYDESIKTYSPALLMQETILQGLYGDRRIARLEYFGRMMDWHNKWTESKRALYHYTYYKARILKRIALRRSLPRKIPAG